MEFYDEYKNGYYVPEEDAGQNENWKSIEKAFSEIEKNLNDKIVVIPVQLSDLEISVADGAEYTTGNIDISEKVADIPGIKENNYALLALVVRPGLLLRCATVTTTLRTSGSPATVTTVNMLTKTGESERVSDTVALTMYNSTGSAITGTSVYAILVLMKEG